MSTREVKVGEFTIIIPKNQPRNKPPRKLHHYKTHGWVKDESRELKSKNKIVKIK